MRHDNGRAILAAYDFSFDGRAAVLYAAELAEELKRDLRIIHVARLLPPTGPTVMSGPAIRQSLRRARAGMAEIAQAANQAHPGVRIRTIVTVGEPADVVVQRSAVAGMVVVGARGLGGHPTLRWGSVSNRIASRARTPVIIVRSSEAGAPPSARHGPIVVLADSEERAAAATEFATELEPDRPTYIVTVYTTTNADHMALHGGRLRLDRLIIRVWNDQPDSVDAVGRMAAQNHARLVVVARDRHGWPFCFGQGSTVHRLASTLECPLAVVNPVMTPFRAHGTEEFDVRERFRQTSGRSRS